MSFDSVEQYLDWGDHTVTVDPIRNSAWIRAGKETHADTVSRGRHYDRKDTEHLLSLLSKHSTPNYDSYVPSSSDLEKLPKFVTKAPDAMTHCAMRAEFRGGDRSLRGIGELPVIAQKLRDGELKQATKATIERQVYRNAHAIDARVLSRSGVPDHGLPC